jgi:UDP-glucose 4-epimerase
MKIGITGGAGYIGSRLTKAYLDEGHDVLVIDNLLHGSSQAIDPRARFYQLDMRDSKLRAVLYQERPDLVSHHAAYWRDEIPETPVLADADVHVRGLLNLLEGCVHAGVRKVIFASNGNSLYRPIEQEALPVKENAPLCPQYPHDISKLAGEWYLRYYTHQYGLKHCILRYADVYGEDHNQWTHHPLTYFIRMFSNRQRPVIRGSGDEIRDHIFIDDVVRANLRALKHGDNQTLHISTGRGCSLNQMCQMVAILLKSDLEPLHISGTLVEECSLVLDNSRAGRVLAWRPEVEMSEGVQRAVQLWRGEASTEAIPHEGRSVTVQSLKYLIR